MNYIEYIQACRAIRKDIDYLVAHEGACMDEIEADLTAAKHHIEMALTIASFHGAQVVVISGSCDEH